MQCSNRKKDRIKERKSSGRKEVRQNKIINERNEVNRAPFNYFALS
jgi:hypothetical protein